MLGAEKFENLTVSLDEHINVERQHNVTLDKAKEDFKEICKNCKFQDY